MTGKTSVNSSCVPTGIKLYLVVTANPVDDNKTSYGKINYVQRDLDQTLKINSILANISFSSIYCSKAPQALQTALKIKGERSCQIFSTPYLNEFCFGKLENQDPEAYRKILDRAIASNAYDTVEKRYSFRVAEDAENMHEVVSRSFNCLIQIVKREQSENVVIVSHIKLISSIVAHILSRDINAVDVEKGAVAMITYLGNNSSAFLEESKSVSKSKPLKRDCLNLHFFHRI